MKASHSSVSTGGVPIAGPKPGLRSVSVAEKVGSVGFTGPLALTDLDVAAATRGDRLAFAAIYDRYASRLFAYCVKTLNGDRDAAADCIQDTFYTAATRLPELRDPEKLRPWLYKIAHNEALRRIRSQRRERPVDVVPESATAEAGPEELAARDELAALITEACDGLTERDRALFELHFRHGLDGPELADTLNITPTDANTRVGRLRATMERSLSALLVARQARAHPGRCATLDAQLRGWDGRLTPKMRKRLAKHVDECSSCDATRRQLVSLRTLLGSVPVGIPAPFWLRDRVLDHTAPQLHTAAGGAGSSPGAAGSPGNTHSSSWWPTNKTAGPARAVHALHGAHLAWAAPLVAAAVAVPLVIAASLTGHPVTVAATTPPDAVTPPPTIAPRFGFDTPSTPTAPPTSGHRPAIQPPGAVAPPAAPRPGTPGLPAVPHAGPGGANPPAVPAPGSPGTRHHPEPPSGGQGTNPGGATGQQPPDSRSATTAPTPTTPAPNNGATGSGG